MQGLCVVAQAPAPARALRRAIAEKVGSVRGGTADDVGLAARCLHVLQRLQFVGIQACMDIGPGDGGVPVHVALEPLFQRLDKDITRCAVFMSAPGNGAFSAWVVACCIVSGPKRRRMACPAATYMDVSAVGCRPRVGWHRRHGFTPPGRCGGGQAAVSPPHGVGVSSCPSCQLLGRGHGQAEGPLTRFYSSNALPQAGSADKILFRNASDRACTTGA